MSIINKNMKVVLSPQEGGQREFLQCPVREVLLWGDRGGGKGLPVDSDILTPGGYVKLRDLKVNDLLLNPLGISQTVTNIYHRGIQPMYDIKFKDGTVISCDADHIWTGIVGGDYVLSEYTHKKRLNTFMIDINASSLYTLYSENKQFTFRIPCPNPLSLGTVTQNYQKLYLAGKSCADMGGEISESALALLSLDEFGEKIHFIQGFLDNFPVYESKDFLTVVVKTDHFAQYFRQLILSLGGISSVQKIDSNTVVIKFMVRDNDILFKEKRKHIQIRTSSYEHENRLYREIESIVRSEDQETICIKVSDPDGLFIIKDYIVTHNTLALLMDYLKDVGKGYGIDYAGLLVREAVTELKDVINKTKKYFPQIFPGAKFNGMNKIWTFPDGETLWLNYARIPDDYNQYHGQEFPWIGWEELTNQSTGDIYKMLLSCNRCSNPRIRPRYRATCNPSGPGHDWVKERFYTAIPAGRILKDIISVDLPDDSGSLVPTEINVSRTHIPCYFRENKILMDADPTYRAIMVQMTKDNEVLRKAWIEASWDLNIGGIFKDVWDARVHIIPEFRIPATWEVTRSFDHGTVKPWSVTYAAITNGDQPESNLSNIPYMPRDSIIVIRELYGWDGTPDTGDGGLTSDICAKIKSMEEYMQRYMGVSYITPGPADAQIWEKRDGVSVGNTMSERYGIHWTKAAKGPNSRVNGWVMMTDMLAASLHKNIDFPHLYFFPSASHHIRTIPNLQRAKKRLEDIDTYQEDHCFTYDTEVTTENGIKKIGDLQGKEGYILSVNGDYQKFSSCRLIERGAKVIKVTFDDGHSVECTPDHKFLTNKGFVEAAFLLNDLDTRCIIPRHIRTLQKAKKPITSVIKEKLKNLFGSRKGSKQNMLKKDVQYVPIHLQLESAGNRDSITVHAKKHDEIGISNIEYIQNRKDVYCLFVNRTHVFALGNGVLVSNCADSLRYLLSRRGQKMIYRKVGVI